MEQKFEHGFDTGELEITEDYIVLDDVASTNNLDLSNLQKRSRSTKIISSAKETIENGKSLILTKNILKFFNKIKLLSIKVI